MPFIIYTTTITLCLAMFCATTSALGIITNSKVYYIALPIILTITLLYTAIQSSLNQRYTLWKYKLTPFKPNTEDLEDMEYQFKRAALTIKGSAPRKIFIIEDYESMNLSLFGKNYSDSFFTISKKALSTLSPTELFTSIKSLQDRVINNKNKVNFLLISLINFPLAGLAKINYDRVKRNNKSIVVSRSLYMIALFFGALFFSLPAIIALLIYNNIGKKTIDMHKNPNEVKASSLIDALTVFGTHPTKTNAFDVYYTFAIGPKSKSPYPGLIGNIERIKILDKKLNRDIN